MWLDVQGILEAALELQLVIIGTTVPFFADPAFHRPPHQPGAAPSGGGSLARRLEFETLLAELSAQFVPVKSHEVGLAIVQGPKRLAEFLAIDIGILWRYSDGTTFGKRNCRGNP